MAAGGGGEASAAGGGEGGVRGVDPAPEEKAAAARVFAAYGWAAGAAGSPPALEVLGFDAKESLSPEPLARAVLGEGGAGDARAASRCTLPATSSSAPPPRAAAQTVPNLPLVERMDISEYSIGYMNVLLDEPKAHKSFRDMDISLDSEFLVSTSTDGSARIWKIDEGAPLVNLTRSSDEKIECCRFSRDGMKPFLFCTVAKGSKVVTVVWNISDWKRIGYKRLLGKPISTLSVSLDGKYLALGSHDGDFCAVDVKKMEVSHWSKKVHLGSQSPPLSFALLKEVKVVISTSHQWGAELTKLNVPADWKEWQVWLVLLALFLASAILFYMFYERSDTFWNFPMGRHQQAKPWNVLKESPPVPEDQNPW
ncbi:unnamed protein product [Miscanthus lutarioriparius]|uniref:SEC12-like protein 1 n=1 Tax=Miscanthus lutarioriparius TaxID=422564 RepID=A0A811SJB2_9POAL|nr:unnamed protein product [Miscanthus lutarioriparius]